MLQESVNTEFLGVILPWAPKANTRLSKVLCRPQRQHQRRKSFLCVSSAVARTSGGYSARQFLHGDTYAVSTDSVRGSERWQHYYVTSRLRPNSWWHRAWKIYSTSACDLDLTNCPEKGEVHKNSTICVGGEGSADIFMSVQNGRFIGTCCWSDCCCFSALFFCLWFVLPPKTSNLFKCLWQEAVHKIRLTAFFLLLFFFFGFVCCCGGAFSSGSRDSDREDIVHGLQFLSSSSLCVCVAF